jgi:hypothetical protein
MYTFSFTKIHGHIMTPFKLILSTMDVHYANLEVSFIHYLYFDVLTIHVISCFTQSGKALSVSSSHRDRNSYTLSTDINMYFRSFRYSFYFISILDIISPFLFNYSDHMDHRLDTLNSSRSLCKIITFDHSIFC